MMMIRFVIDSTRAAVIYMCVPLRLAPMRVLYLGPDDDDGINFSTVYILLHAQECWTKTSTAGEKKLTRVLI